MDEETITREEAKKLFAHHRRERVGIRLNPRMSSVCLICGSIHVVPKGYEAGLLVCQNCGFAFYRNPCAACGETVDGRDPMNPGCRECGLRICTCGVCGCLKT